LGVVTKKRDVDQTTQQKPERQQNTHTKGTNTKGNIKKSLAARKGEEAEKGVPTQSQKVKI